MEFDALSKGSSANYFVSFVVKRIRWTCVNGADEK